MIFFSLLNRETVTFNSQRSYKTSREYGNGLLKAGSTLQFTLTSFETEQQHLEGSAVLKVRNPRHGHINRWGTSIKIYVRLCQAWHGELCHWHSSILNTDSTSQGASKHVDQMPSSANCTLYNNLENYRKLYSCTIKSAIQPVWPKAKHILYIICVMSIIVTLVAYSIHHWENGHHGNIFYVTTD